MSYEFLKDKGIEKKMRELAGSLMQELCHCLSVEYHIGSSPKLIGSIERRMSTIYGNQVLDVDYNLEIEKCKISDCKELKEIVKKVFDRVLEQYHCGWSEDSTSVLTSRPILINVQEKTIQNSIICYSFPSFSRFRIDVCIVKKDNKGYHRLIHEKKGWYQDCYFWNLAPDSKKLKEKEKEIKKNGKWNAVRKEYLSLKNHYLSRQEEENHPSFICHVEAVNNVYNQIKQKKVNGRN